MRIDPDQGIPILLVQVDCAAFSDSSRLRAAARILRIEPVKGIAALERLLAESSVGAESKVECVRLLAEVDITRASSAALAILSRADCSIDSQISLAHVVQEEALKELLPTSPLVRLMPRSFQDR